MQNNDVIKKILNSNNKPIMVNSNSGVGKIIGKPLKKSWYLKDSDGDKVINILDCQPYNKNKQGFEDEIEEEVKEDTEEMTENIKESVEKIDDDPDPERKSFYDKLKDKVKERVQEKKEIAQMAREAASKERKSQAVDLAKYKVRAEYKKKKSRIDMRMKQGTGLSGFVKSFDFQSKERPSVSGERKDYKKVTRYIKDGGKYKKVTSYVPSGEKSQPTRKSEPAKLPQVFTNKMSYDKTGVDYSKGNIDMFGQKKGKGGIPKIF